MNSHQHIPTIINLLYQNKFLDRETFDRLTKTALPNEEPLLTTIAKYADKTTIDIAHTLSEVLGYSLLSLTDVRFESLLTDILEERFIIQHQVIPLKQNDRTLHIAIADPTAFSVIKEIRYLTGLTPEPVIVPQEQLSMFIGVLERKLNLPNMHDEALAVDFAEFETAEAQENDSSTFSDDDAPVIRYVNKILVDAIRVNASDIHFEPYENSYRIRYRVDGVLSIAAVPPTALASRINARLKIMAKLDISERRIPQDGKIKLKFDRTSIDFRVNSTPTLYGEKIVLRILDSSVDKLGLDFIGLNDRQRGLLEQKIALPQGMILVTGPTGSGKTVTIYSALRELNKPEVNISTAEDPVEIQLEGINQVHINNKVGLSFAAALRAFLRQDPDIVMVGEIRDLETAEVAVKAAQTGHLVLSTLHTNSAAETLVRLRNIGIEHYNISSTCELIIAQRLGRKLCDECKEPDATQNAMLQSAGYSTDEISAGITLYKPIGCQQCTNGYRGRIGFFEFLEVTPEVEQMIATEATALEIEAAAIKSGMITLRRSGLNAVKAGITSLEEVLRVTVS